MIQINCDNCEKTFEVRDEDAGGKVACPYCGDINRVESPATPSAVQDRPDGLPPDEGPEERIRIVRPAMFRAHPLKMILIVILVLGGFGLAAWLAWIGKAEWVTSTKVWLPWVGAVIGLIGLGWFAKWWVMAHMWVKLEITNKRIIRHEGIITRRTSEVLHDHIRNVEIRQTFLQRIFGVGYVGVSSAGQDGIEIEVRDIPNPDAVQDLIDRYRDM